MPIPESHYELMHPGRFLRASDLKGQTVTVEIADINAEDMEDEKKKIERAYILSFRGKDKQLVINRTNTFLLAKILGKNPNVWPGHKIALYPTTTSFGSETVECIRVWGSPELEGDIKIATRIGRRPLKCILHAMKGGATKPAAKQEAQHEQQPTKGLETPEQRQPTRDVEDAWGALGWTRAEGMEHFNDELNSATEQEYLDELGRLIDTMNAAEAE